MSLFLISSSILMQLGVFFTKGVPNFYLDQFAYFEEKGFTQQMIEGAKPIYHDFSFYNLSDNAEM